MANEQKQDELFKPDFGWFHFFRTIIQNETWAKMSLAASKLYPVIKSYCNSDNGAAFPSYETLSAKSGLSRPSIATALKELADLKLIAAKKTKGKSTIYSLEETFEVKHPVTGIIGTGTFNYVSKNVEQSIAELKEFLKTGVEGKNITINILTGEHATANTIINEAPNYNPQFDEIIKMYESKPVENS